MAAAPVKTVLYQRLAVGWACKIHPHISPIHPLFFTGKRAQIWPRFSYLKSTTYTGSAGD